MPTVYNAKLVVEERPDFVPEHAYLQTLELFKRRGLAGKFNVNHFGRISSGYDDSCKLFRTGEFNFAPKDIEETAPEILESWFPTTEAGEELKSLAEGNLELIAKLDPSSVILPWNIYREFPLVNSMELVTPYGRQSIHYHTKDNIHLGVIQLWTPNQGKSYYDLLKDFLAQAWSDEFDLFWSLKKPEQKISFFKWLSLKLKHRKLKKLSDLYEVALRNPDELAKHFPASELTF